MHTTTTAVTVGDMDLDADFDLDVSIVETGPIAELMRSTDDNCGSTCETACTSCQS
jgi:FxLD family lantipeptide